MTRRWRPLRNTASSRSASAGAALNAAAARNPPGWLQTRFGRLRLEPHQIVVSKVLVKPNVPGLLLFYKVGSGKTLAAISAAENLASCDGKLDRPVVVILPASLRANFQKELEACNVPFEERYTLLSFQQVHNMAREQREQLGKDALVIIDEVQTLRNPNNRIKGKPNTLDSVLEVAKGAHKRLLLTGTPVMSYPYEIGSAIALLDPKHNAARVLKEWGNNQVAQPVFERTYGKHATMKLDELKSMLRCTVLYYEPSANTITQHYPTKTEHEVKVPLSREQIQRTFQIVSNTIPEGGIVQSLRGLFDIVDRERAGANNGPSFSLMFLTGPRQICNAYDDHHPKLTRAAQAIAADVRNKGRVVVYSSFLRSGLHLLRRLLVQLGVTRVAVFDGNASNSVRKDIVKNYNGGMLDVLMLSDAGKEGLDLKNTTSVHVMEPQWTEDKVQQVIGRAVRYGSHTGARIRHVNVYRYIATMPDDATKRLPPPVRNKLGILGTRSADTILHELSKHKKESINRFLAWLVNVSDENLATCARGETCPPRPGIQT